MLQKTARYVPDQVPRIPWSQIERFLELIAGLGIVLNLLVFLPVTMGIIIGTVALYLHQVYQAR